MFFIMWQMLIWMVLLTAIFKTPANIEGGYGCEYTKTFYYFYYLLMGVLVTITQLGTLIIDDISDKSPHVLYFIFILMTLNSFFTGIWFSRFMYHINEIRGSFWGNFWDILYDSMKYTFSFMPKTRFKTDKDGMEEAYNWLYNELPVSDAQQFKLDYEEGDCSAVTLVKCVVEDNPSSAYEFIVNDFYVYLYCRYVRDRCFMRSILFNSKYAFFYCKYVKNRREVKEHIGSPEWAYRYCTEIKNDPEVRDWIVGSEWDDMYKTNSIVID